jgi:hypothetical protein
MSQFTHKDTSIYLSSMIETLEQEDGHVWAINELGSSFSRVDDDREYEYTHKPHTTAEEAMKAGIGYLWACRPDLVRVADEWAKEAESYNRRQANA